MNSITFSELRAALVAKAPPLVIDVRRGAAFRTATRMIAGSVRRDPEEAATWIKRLPPDVSVVVYCVHGHEVSQGMARTLNERSIHARYLEGGIEEGWTAHGGDLDRKPADANTRWVTRERPKIDRIACPWLIARFVDKDAEFLYVPSKEVLDAGRQRQAVPYDVPGVAFTHDGERCSFDAFLKHYRLSEPALQRLALIVRAADTARPDLAPQAPGLLAVSTGLSRIFRDDHEMLKHGMVLYDALYASCQAPQ
jgi:rhodanese-related sulfurtransferase